MSTQCASDGGFAGARSTAGLAARPRRWHFGAVHEPRTPTLLPLSVAPMMQVTDRHFRVWMRVLTRRTLLWTEMITAKGLLHGAPDHLLGYYAIEHPVVLQIGGDEPDELAAAARIGESFGYDEINLNVGCPSSKVSSGNFGAVLMKDPQRVADCLTAMREAVSVPVTVKHRIGVDDLDRYEDMANFVSVVRASGADRYTVHARKAWLQGLSPKQNRTIPPLRYDEVHRLKRDFPDLQIEINGGFKSLAAVQEQLAHVDAVMIGRAADDDPFLFASADTVIFGEDKDPVATRHEAVRALLPSVEAWVAGGGRLHRMSRHVLGLFAGQRGGRKWRRYISEHAHQPGAGPEVLEEALALVPETERLAS
jgi:tRNA-dihydrouridine synthase A